jgi:hypothetical protein
MTAESGEVPGTEEIPPAPKPLQQADEILFRQIHPNFLQEGVISSATFLPTANDQGELSVDRSSVTTAAASFNLYVGNGRASVAVCGLTVGEFGKEGLPCHPDPLGATETLKANPAHAYADFNGVGTNQRKKMAQRLRTVAAGRGILHSSD